MSERFRVLKFGGSSLVDGPAVQRAVAVLLAEGGARPAVVVSAHHGVTERLRAAALAALRGRAEWDAIRIRHRSLLHELGLASELLDRHLFELKALLERVIERRQLDRRLFDYVLSFGERMSARVFAAALRKVGRPATPLDAFDLGLVTEGPDAGLAMAEERVRRALASVPGIPVITGFLALDGAGHLTTLGRNGSDLSAVWFGEALDADRVQLWKTVPGVMTADPGRVPPARVLDQVGWEQAAALAQAGADVLHPGALEPARRAGLAIEVRSVEDPAAPGTRVFGHTQAVGPLALAHRRGCGLWTEPVGDAAASTARLDERARTLMAGGFRVLAAAVDGARSVLLVQEAEEPSEGELDLQEAALSVGARWERGFATVAVVGLGVGRDAELERRLAADLAQDGANAHPVPFGEDDARTWLCPEDELEAVLRSMHRALFEADSAAGTSETADPAG